MPKILCLLPNLHTSLHARRIDMLREGGYDVAALAFTRRSHRSRDLSCPVVVLDDIPNGRYWSRAAPLLRAVPAVRAALRGCDAAYAFAPDLAGLAGIAGWGLGRPVAIEVADVMGVQTAGGVTGRAVRLLDRLVVNHCGLLVLTTENYFRYYRGWLGVKTPGLVIENKAEEVLIELASASSAAAGANPHPHDDPIRVGWFGMLRDEWTLEVLDHLTRAAPDRYTALLAGLPGTAVRGFDARLAANPNLEYIGPYRHPDDLPDLYGRVDLVMAGKPPKVPHAWSVTNRFYDGCLFGVPLVARAGSGDAARIAEHDIGIVLRSPDAGDAAVELGEFSPPDWAKWRANLSALDPHVYSLTDEGERLKAAIDDLCRRN